MSLKERIAALHEGPSRLAVPSLGDTPFELGWAVDQDFDAFPELEDFEAELSRYLLLATAHRGEELRPILISKSEPHPVYFFFERLQPLADSIEAFAQKLAQPDPRAAAAVLRDGLEEASRAIDAGQFSTAVAKLEEILEPYGSPPAPGERAPLGGDLARGFTDLGFAWHRLGDDTKAARAYELGAAYGSTPARMNLLTMDRDAGDWARAKARAEALLETFKNPEDLTKIRVTYAIALAQLGDAEALRTLTDAHVSYLKWLAQSEAERAVSLRDEFVAKLKDASIEAAAQVLLAPMIDALSSVSLVTRPKTVTDRDVARALEAIEKRQEFKFENWLKARPALAEDPRILEAVDALPEPAASTFRAVLRGR